MRDLACRVAVTPRAAASEFPSSLTLIVLCAFINARRQAHHLFVPTRHAEIIARILGCIHTPAVTASSSTQLSSYFMSLQCKRLSRVSVIA